MITSLLKIQFLDQDFLDEAKLNPRAATSFLDDRSGTILHEVGHLVAAAKFGIPVDYMIFDWSRFQNIRHGVVIHSSFHRKIQTNVKARVGIQIGGYAAEHLCFGRADLQRAQGDIQSLAIEYGVKLTDYNLQAKELADRALAENNPIDHLDLDPIIDIYNAISGGLNKVDIFSKGWMYPNYLLPPLPYRIGWLSALRANLRSRKSHGQEEALNLLDSALISRKQS